MMKRTEQTASEEDKNEQSGDEDPDIEGQEQRLVPDDLAQQRKRPRQGSHEEHESAAAILALAEAAHQRTEEDDAAQQSEDLSEDAPRRKRGQSFESDVSSSIPARASASGSERLQESGSERGVPEGIMLQTFPQKLMEMLDTKVVPDAMWWTNKGKAFALDLSKFEVVLHKHFQSAKYPSFTRKLNKWGFRKLNTIDVTAPSSVVMYRHDLFIEGQPELLKQMSTKRKKKDKGKAKKMDSKGTKRSELDSEEASERKDNTEVDHQDKKKAPPKSKGTKRKRAPATHRMREQALPAVQVESEQTATNEVKEAPAEDSDAEKNQGGGSSREEERSTFFGELRGSPALVGARPQRYSERTLDGESKASDTASDAIRQQIQQQLSLASSLASQRLTDRSIYAALPPSPGMMREQALRLQDEQAALLRQAGHAVPQVEQDSALRALEQRRILESFIAAESEQHQRLGLSLMQQNQQRRQSLASDFLTQQYSATAAPSGGTNITGAMNLQDRLLAARDTASRNSIGGLGTGNLSRTDLGGVAPFAGLGSSSLSNYAGNYLGGNYSGLASGLNSQTGASDGSSLFQLQRQLGLGSNYNSLTGTGSLSSQSNTSDNMPSLQMQLQLQLHQQHHLQHHQLGTASIGRNLSSSDLPTAANQPQSEDRLLALLADRQRLQAELLRLQQQQQQQDEQPE